MQVLILAGLLSATAPMTTGAEGALECQIEAPRRAEQTRLDAPPPTPAAQPTRPAAAVRETAEQAARPDAQRRRSGKGIPDAELIGPRGAL